MIDGVRTVRFTAHTVGADPALTIRVEIASPCCEGTSGSWHYPTTLDVVECDWCGATWLAWDWSARDVN